MLRILASLVCGLLFGLGLAVSQMINPAKVIGFLDVTGNWDPSLALVMLGAVSVMGIARLFILRRPAPLLDRRFHLPRETAIDMRLIGGAAVFGIGWGLSGFCPGPAIASIGLGDPKVVVFVLAIGVGSALYRFGTRKRTARLADNASGVELP